MRCFLITYIAAAITVSSIPMAQQKQGVIPHDVPAWGVVLVGAIWPLVGLGLACVNLDLCQPSEASRG